jgi:hypothetical protein
LARQNVPFISIGNRGLISPKALARVDLDRTRLSAEVFTNWIGKTQGALTIRPGTKYFGSSLNDTGAEWIEFVASTDDVALLELTHEKMRVWLGEDAHALELLARPAVDTTVGITDTGWSNASTGGAFATSAVNAIPAMTGNTTNGVTVSAKSFQTLDDAIDTGGNPWHAADNSQSKSRWQDTGTAHSNLPSWWKVNFGSGNAQAITSYSIRAPNFPTPLPMTPKSWELIRSNFDTGTFAVDTGKWGLEDARSSQTGWAVNERRSYELPGADTGTIEAYRYWRLTFKAVNNITDSGAVSVNEIEMFTASQAQQVKLQGGQRVLNASAIGSRAKAVKRVLVSDTGTEHSLAITVERGPVTLRVGSTNGDDDYISETALGTGYHNLAFTPSGNFWITLQSDAVVDRIVSSLSIGDSGTVEIASPWQSSDLNNVRYDQSADVVYVDCDGIRQQKIERRGSGRSWSVVDYAPNNGPFLPTASSSAKMMVSHFFGNTTLESDIPFFTPDHIGALIRIFHDGQSGQWRLGAAGAHTDPIKMTGISDTGTPDANSERRIVFSVSGVWAGRITFERSIDGEDIGFKPVPTSFTSPSDTGSFTKTIDDQDDNLAVWYRARIADTGTGSNGYTSGVAVVDATYGGGGVTGIARITDYNSNTSVGIEVLSRFSDTGPSDNWQEGYWSDARRFPTAVSLHGGRLAHASGGSLFLSVSDDYENFDDTTEGDAGPIIRTLGSGPVDAIRYLISKLRMIIGTAGAELALTSSSLDEPVTPTNSNARAFSTQGSANLRAVHLDARAIMVQRSGQRVFMIGPSSQGATFGDYEGFELTLLVPDLLAAGVVSIAIQRQPDTRLHCVLADGRVAILTYEPNEEVICWTLWEGDTGTDAAVERVAVLPGANEDAVFYHVRRTIALGNDVFTKVLLHFDGTDAATAITDVNAGGSAHSWTASGNAQIDTAQSKFGGSSGLFDGTGDYLTTPDHADFALGSGDFTVDCWFNCNVAAGSFAFIFSQGDAGGADSSLSLFRSDTNFIRAEVYVGASNFTVTGTTQFTNLLNTGWHHVAFVRTGNVLRLFIDGVQEGGDVAVSGTVNDSAFPPAIGIRADLAGALWTGWIDEFRLSVGIARWTANFQPPSRAYGTDHVRYLEKWALESECTGDSGLTWIMDCARSYTDTGRTATLTDIATHLIGESLVVWSDDTGSIPGVDRSPDVDGVQTRYIVDTGGDISLATPVHHAVAGLPFTARWVSSKLAYAAELGSALGQVKRPPQVSLILYKTHNRGIFFGSDTGSLDPLPRKMDGATVDPDRIFETLDMVAVPMPSTWKTDPRLALLGKSPRPVTLLAAVPTVVTNEK